MLERNPGRCSSEVEQLFRKQQVEGSNPPAGSTYARHVRTRTTGAPAAPAPPRTSNGTEIAIMSKLRERIRTALRPRPAPLGFGAHDRGREVSRNLVVLAEVADPAAATAAASADALLYSGDSAGVAAVIEAAADLPLGARIPAATAADAAALLAAGADFLLFDDAETEAAALLGPDLGYVALLGDGLAAATATEDQLRLLQPLDLDAILVPAREGAMTVRDQLVTRRIAELTRKSLIVPVATTATATELEVLRDAGAPAVLASGADRAALERLIAAAAEVPAPRERREERPDALVPAALAPAFDEDDDEPL